MILKYELNFVPYLVQLLVLSNCLHEQIMIRYDTIEEFNVD